jgi:hypothetical protein
MTPNVTLCLCPRPLEITSRAIVGGDTKTTKGLTSSGVFLRQSQIILFFGAGKKNKSEECWS